MPVIDEIAAERKRQIEVEGWTAEHDAQHGSGQIALAGLSYILQAVCGPTNGYTQSPPPQLWPWEARWWKPKDRRRDLIRAGALIVAEIERLDRLEPAHD